MRRGNKAGRGSGFYGDNALSRELTSAKWKARFGRNRRRHKPIKPALQPAPFVPEQRLIKKKDEDNSGNGNC